MQSDSGTHGASPEPEDDGEDIVEQLLGECLQHEGDEQSQMLDRVCSEHPQYSQALRQRYQVLQELGLLDSGSADEAAEDAAVDKQFGEFQLIKRLGRGGMGIVYLAQQPSMGGRNVALKIIRPDLLDEHRVRERFRREVKAASGLDDPGICTVYEAGEVEGTPYIAMRYVPGETLSQRLDRLREDAVRDSSGRPASGTSSRRLSRSGSGTAVGEREILRIVQTIERVARSLHVAHEAGLVHRDVKPANIMVQDDETPVLLDFGLARITGGDLASLTVTGHEPGTPAYMSPEQISPGDRDLDRRTDIYSLGVTLFECLTLRLPFEGITREQLYREILTSGTPDTRAFNRAIPTDLRVVLATAMERDPNRRYRTALDFADDLRHVRLLEPIAARRPSAAERAWRWTRREPLRAALAVLLLLGAFLAGLLISSQSEIAAGQRALMTAELDRHLMRGYQEFSEGSPVVANTWFDRALELDPGSLEALGGKALALDACGKRQEALEFLQQRKGPNLDYIRANLRREYLREGAIVLPQPNADPVSFLFAGLLEVAKGESGTDAAFDRAYWLFHEALLRCRFVSRLYLQELVHAAGHGTDKRRVQAAVSALLGRFPDEPFAILVAAKALYRVDLDGAEASFKRLLKDPILAVTAKRWLGRILIHRKEVEKGKAMIVEAMRGQKDPHALHIALAFMHHEAKEWARAEAEFKKGLAQGSVKAIHHFRLGESIQMQGRHEESIPHYKKALELYPGLGQAQVHLGMAYLRTNRIEEAVAAFERAVVVDPLVPEAHLNLGTMMREKGELDRAEKCYQRALDLSPRHPIALRGMGRVFERRGNKQRAAIYYNRALMHLSRTEDAPECVTLGLDLRRMNYLAEAGEAFRKAIALDEKHAWAHYNLSVIHMRLGEDDKARAALVRTLELDPNHGRAHNNLGKIQQKRGQVLAALRSYEAAVDCNPDNVITQRNLAYMTMRVGNNAGALDASKTALELAPGDPTALFYQGQALIRAGRASEAISILKQAHAGGSKQKDWRVDSLSWVERARKETRSQARCRAVLAGKVEPADAQDVFRTALFAIQVGRFRDALSLFQRGFRMAPEYLQNYRQPYRYYAACAAASLALTTREVAEAKRLRRQALDWMRADLLHWRRLREVGSQKQKRLATTFLGEWLFWWEIRGIRDPQHLAKLDPGERADLERFWVEVRSALPEPDK